MAIRKWIMNPTTGKPIIVGGRVYKRLIKQKILVAQSTGNTSRPTHKTKKNKKVKSDTKIELKELGTTKDEKYSWIEESKIESEKDEYEEVDEVQDDYWVKETKLVVEDNEDQEYETEYDSDSDDYSY